MEKIIAKGYPRLHWSLVDMSASTHRMYGGFGVAIDASPVIATATHSDHLNIEMSGSIGERTKRNLNLALERANRKQLPIDCNLNIHSDLRQHIGFGSSTQIILTAMDAIATLNNWNISPTQIIELSGRGRTSLIGFSTHYWGGFCIDAGQPYNPNSQYLPSHNPQNRKPSIFIGSWDFPVSWQISLLGESSPISMPTDRESMFMSTHAPMKECNGFRSVAELYHGILPSVISEDYTTFSDALRYFHLHGWSSIEMQLQNQSTISALYTLWDYGFAAALSSFGPLISVIHKKEDVHKIIDVAMQNHLSYSGPYSVIPKHDKTKPSNPYIYSLQ